MEYIVLGFILFIVGVAATFVYDHVKAEQTKRAQYRAANPRPTKSTSTPSKKNPLSAPTYQADVYDQMIASVKERARRGETHMRVQAAGQREQTMTVDDLIKRLEQMKKSL